MWRAWSAFNHSNKIWKNALIACFDIGITEAMVKHLAQFEPLWVVFRDNGFVSDAVKINVEQIFKQMSSGTEVRAICAGQRK